METVAAIASPPGQGAVALIRISGPHAFDTAQRIFWPRKVRADYEIHTLPARVQHFGLIHDGGEALDEVLLSRFIAPSSFTGEDVVEIACHGGALVTRRILELALRSGASPAEPGEFTRRAYLNGKMDLTQAEAVMDLIGAQSDRALKAAVRQLAGDLGTQIRESHSNLLGVLAHLEAYIDFPEEDIAPDTGEQLLLRIRSVLFSFEQLLLRAREGRILRAGARTVLSGPPNVGKSSLLNRLLGFDRAIVSAVAGTTRDTLEEVVMVRGWPLRLIDTAGIRTPLNAIEEEGIARAYKELEQADLILEVFDASLPAPDDFAAASGERLRVLNKADLSEHPSWKGVSAVRISCRSGSGMSDLEEMIELRLKKSLAITDDENTVAINARHQDCLRRSVSFLKAAEDAFRGGLAPEFVAEELRAALGASGEIVGKTDAEDLLGRIFSTFCIGK